MRRSRSVRFQHKTSQNRPAEVRAAATSLCAFLRIAAALTSMTDFEAGTFTLTSKPDMHSVIVNLIALNNRFTRLERGASGVNPIS